jgi:tetratricopeptide (TPR) repeat protein
LAFFYLLPYIKEKYFETVEELRPIITINLYEELKSNFVRKRVLYLGLLIIYISILVTVFYEIILGFEVGFWTENMPAWSVFRFGLTCVIFVELGVIIIYMFGADAFNGCVSWLIVPFLLDKDITKSAYRDPAILRKVKVFEKFNKNLVRMTLIIVLMVGLALFLVIQQPVPVAPNVYVWIAIIMFVFVPLISASRLRGRAIKKLIDILESQYEDSVARKLECEAAENAEALCDTHRAENDHIKSQEYLKKAAEKYEECGDYQKAAQRYSKQGNYKKAATCYKKASDREDVVEKKKYYKACAYTEKAEEFIEAYNRDKSSKCLSLAATYFKDIAMITSNLSLKNSALYHSREASGRLLVLDALKIYEEEIDKNRILNNVFGKLSKTQSIFEETSKICLGIGKDAEIQLKVHASMCEFYKQYLSFKHTIPEYEIDDTTAVSAGPKILGLKRRKTKKYRPGEFSKLDECIEIIQEISKKLWDIYKFNAAKKAEMIEYTLRGYKFYKKGKNEEALENVEIAENIGTIEFSSDIGITLFPYPKIF